MTQNNQLLHSLTLRNLLSFGPLTPAIPLGPLNVLIGPNGSGKSNFIEAAALLRAMPGDLRAPSSPVVRGGGIAEWIWKGDPRSEATIDAVVSNPSGKQALRHVITFDALRQAFHLVDEKIENEKPDAGWPDAYFYYRY